MIYLYKTKTFALLFSILMLFAVSVNAQWDIPADAKNKQAPEDPTYSLVKTGKDLYNSNCSSCHGKPGEGNNITAINATDLGISDYQSTHTGGQVYWQFNEGMGAMPSFKDKFNEDEKWFLAFYIKSFDKNFKISGEELKIQKGNIDLKKDESAYKVFANVTITDDEENSSSAEGIDIIFYVKRYFGLLQIGNAIQTNQVGTAVLNFPDNIQGDENGKIEVFAKFKNKDAFGSAVSSTVINMGIPLIYEDITKERTMWGANDKVPLWILFSYLAVTIGVWLVIIYVVFQIKRLKKAGK